LVRLKKYPVIVLSALVASAALLLGMQGVFAQAAPPVPPTASYWGTVSGGPVVGDQVVAFVTVGGTSSLCGTATVIQVDGIPRYVVDVYGTGCGGTGAIVRFYFPRIARFAAQTPILPAPNNPNIILELNLTMGTVLGERSFVPNSANDAAR
jgi:hypothetical protein